MIPYPKCSLQTMSHFFLFRVKMIVVIYQNRRIQQIMKGGILLNRTNKIRLTLTNTKPRVLVTAQSSSRPKKMLNFSPFHKLSNNVDFNGSKTNLSSKKLLKSINEPNNEMPSIKNTAKSIKSITDQNPQFSMTKIKQTNRSQRKIVTAPKTPLKSEQSIKSMIKISDNKQYMPISIQIMEMLKLKLILLQSHMSSYTIKKQNLLYVLNYLAEILTAKYVEKYEEVHFQYSNMMFLKQPLQKLAKQARSNRLTEYENRAKLYSKTVHYQYSSQQYQNEKESGKNQLQQMRKEKEMMSVGLKELREGKEMVVREIDENRKQIKNQIIQKMELQDHINKLKQEQKTLMSETQKMKYQSNQIQACSNKIKNYINEQSNNRIIQLAGEEYQKIQADIYQYAVYLQSNQLASSLEYEPLPFHQIQEIIGEQMKTVNKTLIQDNQLAFDQKYKLMRDFVLKTMDKFKRKDGQMAKLNEFKTKCIRNFVNNMQKWLDNWTLKQEYLVNLRNQFAADSEMRKIGFCTQCQRALGDLKGQLGILFKKIEVNYKLGNSFY